MAYPTPDFPFGYRLLPDVACRIRATAHERHTPRAPRPARVHRLHWRPRRARTARDR